MALIRGTRAAATVSGSSAKALKKRLATGEEPSSSRSVSTIPGDRLWQPMLVMPARKGNCSHHL